LQRSWLLARVDEVRNIAAARGQNSLWKTRGQLAWALESAKPSQALGHALLVRTA